jgi:hypothetical protein
MLANVRRRLLPLRPVLGPPYRLVRDSVREGVPWSIPNLVERASNRVSELVRRLRHRPRPAIRALRHVELVDLAAAEPYYRPRRGYLGVGAGPPAT